MARVASLDAEALAQELSALRAASPDPAAGDDGVEDFLTDLHLVLIRGAASLDPPPAQVLADAAAMLGAVPERSEDRLPPRPRTAFRLLRAGALDACWAVLADNAVGHVREAVQESTSSGALRTAWPLPSLTYIDEGRVFADLPGFRDPRYSASQDCYDLSDVVRVSVDVDDVRLSVATIRLGGVAALEHLEASADEQVMLVAVDGESQVAIEGRRLRRSESAAARAAAPGSNAWSGWSADIEVVDPRLGPGSWTLWLQIGHDGVDRRAPLDQPVTALARAALEQPVDVAERSASLEVREQRLSLVIAGRL